MNNAAPYRNKKVFMEMLAAFVLYKEEGMSAVERMYPEHVSFVLSHKNKSQAEVKKELLNRQAA
jgi:hypothetical protein